MTSSITDSFVKAAIASISSESATTAEKIQIAIKLKPQQKTHSLSGSRIFNFWRCLITRVST